MTAKFFEFNEYMTAVFKVQKCLRPFKHCTAPSTLLELRSFCETNHIGLKVGLGNIEILNVESGPKALIDFQVINMKVVPRPIIFSNESNKLHDTIEIDRSYYTGSCMSALVVGAKLVRVKDFSGTAKSSFLKRVLSVHPQSPVIAPTNRETTVSSGLLAHIAAKHKIILVDEFFMCDYWMLHAFMTLTRLGTVIVGAGDEYQLPSISLLPGHIFDSHSSVMRIIFRKILRLSKVLRSEGAPAAILAECVRSHTINLLNAREAPLDLTASRHLTYTNIASDNLNALVLQSKIRLYRKILWCSGKDIGIATCMREVPKGSVMFTRNSPLRLQTSNVYGTRNTSFVLKSFYKTNGFYYARLQYDHQGPGTVTLEAKNDELVVNGDDILQSNVFETLEGYVLQLQRTRIVFTKQNSVLTVIH